MSEEGGRAEGYRRTGPNPGPYPWPGPGPGTGVPESTDPSRRLQVKQHHSVKKCNLPGVCDHRPVYERPSEPRDMSGSRASTRLSSTASSVPRQPELHGTEDRYVRCVPCEDGSKTPTISSTHGTHFRNKALLCKFNGLKVPNDRDARKSYQENGHRSMLSNVLSPGKIHGASGNRNFQDERNHSHHTKLKRKHHSVKVLDPVTYPVSIHPVQPPNLRCKNIVHRESFRHILGGDATISETRPPGQNKKSRTKLVCAETSNPDIKISNVDEACATTFSYIESAENVIADVLGSNFVLNKHEESLNNSLPIDGGHSLDEYSVIGRHDPPINRGDYVPCPEVHFTTPDGNELKMERYFPPEEDSIEYSIHTCGMSSSMVSRVTLEHEMSPSEKLARVLPRRNTPLNMFSTDTIASMAEKEVIEVPNDIDSSRVGKFLHRASYSTLSGDQSSDEEDDSNNEIFNRYLKESCNDSDYNRSKVNRATAQERSVGISDATEKFKNVRISHIGEMVHPQNLSDDNRSPDMLQGTGISEEPRKVQGTDDKIEDADGKISDADTRIADKHGKTPETDTRISDTDENVSSAFIQLLKTAENVPDTAVTIADTTEIIPDSSEGLSYAAEMILDAAKVTSHPAAIITYTSMTSGAVHRTSDTGEKIPRPDGRMPDVNKGCSDKTERYPIEDKVSLDTNERSAIDRPDMNDKVSVTVRTCRRTSGDKLPKQNPCSLECKPSTVQTADGRNVNVKQNSKVNMVVVVSRTLEPDCSEEIHLKVKPNDLRTDIREEHIKNLQTEPSLQNEARETLSEHSPLVTGGLIGDETIERRNRESDRVILTARTPNDNYSIALPQAINTKVFFPLHQRKNEAKESCQTVNPDENAPKTIIQPGRQETKRAGAHGQDSLVQSYRSAEKSQAESCGQRRNTFPIIRRDMTVLELGNFLVENSAQTSHNGTPTEELFLTTEAQDKSNSNNVKARSAQDSSLFENLSRNNVSCQLITVQKPSNYSMNAERQVRFLANTEASELAECGKIVTKALRDELSDNRADMVCSGVRRGSDENPAPSRDSVEACENRFKVSCAEPRSGKAVTIFPTKMESNHEDVISHSKSFDSQQASQNVSVRVIPVEQNKLLDKTLPSLNVTADEPDEINTYLVKDHFDEGINCGRRFQSRATQDDFSGTSPFIHRSNGCCRESEDFEGEIFSKAESFSNGSSILTPADESISSEEFTVKIKTQDESYLTAVFRRNSNDLHSSLENLESVVQSKAVSARTSISTNPSGHISSPINYSRDSNTESSSRVYKISKGEACSIVNQVFELNNESNTLRRDTTRFVEYGSQLVQDQNNYKLISAKVENIGHVLEQGQHKKPAEVDSCSHKIFECQEYIPFRTIQESVTLYEANNQNELHQSDGFPLVSQDTERKTFKEVAYQENEKRQMETGKANIRNYTETSCDDMGRSCDITRRINEIKILDTEGESLEKKSFNNEKKNFDSEETGLENTRIGFHKAENGFLEGKRNSDTTGTVDLDSEKKSLDNRKSSSSNVGKDLGVLVNSFSNIGHCLDSSVKTQEEDKSSRCDHDDSIDEVANISQSNGNLRHVLMLEDESSKERSFTKNVEQHTTDVSFETAGRNMEKASRETMECVPRCAPTSIHDSGRKLPESQATIKFGCVQFENKRPESIPIDSVMNSGAPCLDKRDSLKDETRDTSICGELPSDSEDPVSMAEQLNVRGFEAEVNDENTTSKSVADLTEEDIIPPKCEKRYDNVNAEKVSLDNNSDNVNEPRTSTLQLLDGSIEKRKSEVSNYSVKRSSSGVQIITFDDSCQVSALVKITDLGRGMGKLMNVQKSQSATNMTPKSCSQNVTERGISPHVMLPEDEATTCKSFLSFGTTRGVAAKGGLRSERSSKGSGRVEWTISVNDENGIETRRSVDIITLNDTTEASDTGRHSNVADIRATVESPGISCCSLLSSHNTRVLMHPTSSPSVGTTRDLSEVAYTGVCKTPTSGIQLTEENQTRTKLTKKRLDKVETRQRVHLFEVSGNTLEMYGGERKKKSLVGYARTFSSDDVRGRYRRSTIGHSFNDKEDKRGNSRCVADCSNHKAEKLQNGNSLPGKQGAPNSIEENEFEPYRSISDLYLTQSTRMASDSDNEVLSSPEQSVSPSLVNLGRFTPSNPSSWSTLRHRQIKSNRTASNVLTVPPTHSRTSNKTSRFLHSHQDINLICPHLDTRRRLRRSDCFPPGSSEQLRCTICSRPGWNMLTDAPEEPEEIREVDSGAVCSASYVPEGSHATRVVTFENIPSPRSTLRRSTLTPRGESVQTFDPSESCEDATQPPKSPTQLRFCSKDRLLQVSRLSSDASNCGADELSSAAQMSHQVRVGSSIARNRYYEEIPFISTSHESIHASDNSNVERFQTIWPKTPGYLSPKRSSAVQTYPASTRSHYDVRVLTASKTTLLSLAEACGHSTSRLSSPTPSDIPSPPPNPSPNRHTNNSQSKVDVAVGVNTLDCDGSLGARISESALHTVHNCNDSTTTIQIPVSPTGNRYGSVESENATSFPTVINSSLVPGISNAGQCFDDKANESNSIPIVVPSNIYPKNIAVSRGVVVTSNAADVFNTTTPNSSFETGISQKNFSTSEHLETEQSSGKSRSVVSRLRTPPILAKISDSETTSASILHARKPETTDEKGKNMRESDDSINTTNSSSNLPPAEIDGNKIHRPLVVGGHYRFGSAGQRVCNYYDLMGDINEVNTAVPSRSTLTHSSGPINRLSPNVTVGSHTRYIGARISCSTTGDDFSSDFKEPHGCHRERESYAQKPRPKLIKRPADASCTPSKTSNTIQQTSDEAKEKSARSENSKRPLPPAALDQNEEVSYSKQGARGFSNAGVVTDLALNKGVAPVEDAAMALGTSTVRFSSSLMKSQAGSAGAETRGQSICLSTAGTGSVSCVGPLSSSTPGTAGKSVTSSLRESTGQDVSSMTRHDVSTPTSDPLMDQLSPSAGGTAHCGVICPELNESNLHHKRNICLSMKSRNNGVPSRDMFSGQNSRMPQDFTSKQTHNQTTPTEFLGYYSTCVPIKESPDSPSYESDANSETQKSRGTLASQGQIQESIVTETVESQGQRSSRSSSAHSSNKRKSSSLHKSLHATGSKTKRGSVRKHVSRTSSKTVQPKNIPLTGLEKPSNPPPTTIDDGGPQVQSRIPRVTSHDDCGEEEAIYIEEVSETIEDIPTDRLECEGDGTSIPAPQVANAESMVTETFDLSSDALPRSLTKSEDLFARPDAPTSSRGMTGLVTEMSEMSGQSYHSGSPRESASETATDQDVKSIAMLQDRSGRVPDARAETGRQLQIACISDAICKNAKHPSPGKRYGLYTSRVGYIGPPRPSRPVAATASRAVAEKNIQFPFILARPEAKPKRKCQTIYDKARGKAPFKEEKCERNYVHANIQHACQSVPLKKPARFVDSVHGHTQLLEPSGLEPHYVFRKDYGIVPTYLSQAAYQNGGLKGKPGIYCPRGKSKAVPTGSRRESTLEADGTSVSLREEIPRHPLRYITEPERAQLLEGLKQNWQELTTVFQGLPVMTDTMAKMKRKETLENELRQLERDIATIEQNPIIYIDQGAGDACDAAHIWID